jgi:plasmid stability protein
MHIACYLHAMANLQIRDLPEDLHDELRRRAEKSSTSVRGYVIELIRRDQAHASPQDWLEEIGSRGRIDLGEPAADLIRAAREEQRGGAERS